MDCRIPKRNRNGATAGFENGLDDGRSRQQSRARREIAMIKAVVPPMALKIIDRAIQAHGGAGVCEDFPLANFWIVARMLRIADGPDEVHLESIAKMELNKYRENQR